MKKLYYKNKLIISLIKPIENKRLFTPLKLNILTLKDFKLWPENLIALDAFSQTGLQWTRIFADEAQYLEMWDIDQDAISYAAKEFPKAKTVCGDTLEAFKLKKFGRQDFNFVLIDSPVPFQYADGSFEHFVFFDHIFDVMANKGILVMDVVPDINTMLSIHPCSEEFKQLWIKARSTFYGVKDGERINPAQMIEIYKSKVNALGCKTDLVTYNARNQHFGFITIAISK